MITLAVDSYIHHFLLYRNEGAPSRHRLFYSTRISFFFLEGGQEGLMMEIVHDGARVDSFLGGKFLGLVKMNKLEQLRKYIFAIEIESIQFEQVSKK